MSGRVNKLAHPFFYDRVNFCYVHEVAPYPKDASEVMPDRTFYFKSARSPAPFLLGPYGLKGSEVMANRPDAY